MAIRRYVDDLIRKLQSFVMGFPHCGDKKLHGDPNPDERFFALEFDFILRFTTSKMTYPDILSS